MKSGMNWQIQSGLLQIILAELAAFFKPLPDVDFAAVFGPFARAAARPNSEIDLMIRGDLSWLRLSVQLRPLERAIGHRIHLTVFNRDNHLTRWEGADGDIYSIEDSLFFPINGTWPPTSSHP